MTVTEDEIGNGVQMAWSRLHLALEPTGAFSLAACLAGKLPKGRTGLVLSGGNANLRNGGYTPRTQMIPVKEVMTRNVITFNEDTPVEEIAQTLTSKRITGAPVVADEGHVVGIVSEVDVFSKKGYGCARHHEPARDLGHRGHRHRRGGDGCWSASGSGACR